MQIHLLGIRHHGPGSAKSLLKALHEIQPDVILLEGTEEADALMKYVIHKELKPPVAVLIYNPKELSQAVYYPYTEFSPEWQAIKFGLENKVPIVNFDLPQGIRFAEKLESETQFEDVKQLDIYDEIRRDPLGFMGKLAGYDDGERWWESTFEHYNGDATEVFDKILLLMQTMREEKIIKKGKESEEEDLREAYMRKCLRDAVKSGYQRIAVVCGAWHTPALDLDLYPAKADNALLKGLTKVKMNATWIPWTYDRISRSSGYGAGVISPAWYKLLFQNADDAVIKWMTKVAQLFREEDMDASSAHVIEAVRLAETLAAMRGLQLPGIDELFEAAQTVFTQGESKAFELVNSRLVIGEEMGDVPTEIASIPLQNDIETQIKTLRLAKYKIPLEQDIKKEGLDLRNEFDRKQSVLLHRLCLLGINWGKEKSYSGREKTTMKEYWSLCWDPEFVFKMIEASIWGNTVEQAASNLALQQAKAAENLSELTDLLQQVIKAKLPDVMDDLLFFLRDSASLTKDVPVLMRTVPNMVSIMRYGDVRKSDFGMLEGLLKEIVPRICIGLPTAAASMDDDASQELFQLIVALNQALNLHQDDGFKSEWLNVLELLSDSNAVKGIIQGISCRLLFDSGTHIDIIAKKMEFALSKAAEVNIAASWIQGFLFGSGLLLIHNPQLWNILDTWVLSIKPELFQELLPLLRRSFSEFSRPERERMLSIAKNGQLQQKIKEQAFNKDSVNLVIGTLKTLIG